MKTACVLAVLGSAAAVAPPRIELDLSEVSGAHHEGGVNVDHTKSIYREHDQQRHNIDHAAMQNTKMTKNGAAKRVAVRSRQDWTEKCAAGVDNHNTCHFPIARAWDFVDNEITVSTRVFKVDELGQTILIPEVINAADIDFGKRATYLFKYDATDQSGNHAEQVVFALIVDDPTPPVFHFGPENIDDVNYKHSDYPKLDKYTDNDINGNSVVATGECWNIENNCDPNTDDTCVMKVEASRHPSWGLFKCTGSLTASDNVDPTHSTASSAGVTSTIRYSVIDAGTNAPYVCATTDKCYRGPGGKNTLRHVSPERISEYLGFYKKVGTINLELHAHDFAGVYGSNSQNNYKTAKLQIDVEDTLPPMCHVHGEDEVNVECFSTMKYKRCSAADFQTTELKYGADVCDGGVGCFDEMIGKLPFPELGQPAAPYHIDHTINTDNAFDEIGHKQTDYTVTYQATDPATSGGVSVGSASRVIKVADTVAPTITLVGDGDQTLHQQVTSAGFSNIDKTTCASVLNQKNEKHSVCAHSAGDTFQDPGIQLDDGCDEDAFTTTASPNHSGDTGIWKDVACPTGKDEIPSTETATSCWGGAVFNDRMVGKYVRTYNIQDQRQNAAKAYRTFHVVDMTAPEIKPFGDSIETFEASRDVEYTDQGARCEDYVDGDISHNVEVSGEIVNMKVPGTYNIQYDCQDNNGNVADRKFRTIVIEDNGCPYITLAGETQVYVEAGFPYHDKGATATDTLDGDITARIRSVGNTVNTAEAFYYAGSCEQIQKIAESAAADARGVQDKNGGHQEVIIASGEYYITVTTMFPTQKQEAVVVMCDFDASPATTYFKLDAQRYAQDMKEYQIVDADAGNSAETHAHHVGTVAEQKYEFRYPTCQEFGFINFVAPSAGVQSFAQANFGSAYALTTAPTVHTDRRLCTLASGAGYQTDITKKTMPAQRAEVGTYVITYYVSDLANNGKFDSSTCQQGSVKRTVTVEDTLPPVLTLKYRGSVLTNGADGNHNLAGTAAKSAARTGSQYNPAYYKISQLPASSNDGEHQTKFGNPAFSLMAQAASTNGWLIAAVASGIAGVALFGVSLKKSSSNVPVPV